MARAGGTAGGGAVAEVARVGGGGSARARAGRHDAHAVAHARAIGADRRSADQGADQGIHRSADQGADRGADQGNLAVRTLKP